MRKPNHSRWGKAGAANVALVLLGCGAPKSLGADADDHDLPATNGGTAGSAGTATNDANGPDGQGGVGDLPEGMLGGAAAQAPGSGGKAGERDPRYRFVLVPALERPNEVPAPDPEEPDDELTYAVEVQEMSADGSMLLGISHTILSRYHDVLGHRYAEETYWTNLASPAPKSLGADFVAQETCLAEDGSAALLLGGDPQRTVRWSLTGGPVTLMLPMGLTLGIRRGIDRTYNRCSADVSRASFGEETGVENVGYGYRPVYWQLGSAGDDFVEVDLPEPNAGAELFLGLDGGPGVLNVYLPAPEGSFRSRLSSWTPETGTQPFGTLDDCWSTFLSGDASVIGGHCQDKGQDKGFLWRRGELSVLDDTSVLAVSRDGSTVLGSVRQPDGRSRLVSWRGDAAMQETDELAFSWGVDGLSDDGLSAYVRGYELDGGRVLRWTADGNVTALSSPPGFDRYSVVSLSQDAKLALFESQVDDSRYALLDSQGVRDVLSELEAAGVLPADVSQIQPQNVRSNGSSVFIQGACIVPSAKIPTAFVAVLPAR